MSDFLQIKPSLNLFTRRSVAFLIDLIIGSFVALIFTFIDVLIFKRLGGLWIPTFVDNTFFWAVFISFISEANLDRTTGMKLLGLTLMNDRKVRGPKDLARSWSLFLRNFLKYLPWMLLGMGNLLPLFTVVLSTPEGGLSLGYMRADELVQKPMNMPIVITAFFMIAIYVASTLLQGKCIYDRITRVYVNHQVGSGN